MADASGETVTRVVTVGASAGGLVALEAFFEELPERTGAAYVVIQHLAPDHKSMMKELLSRRTRVPVRTAQDGLPIEPDHVYVIAPETNLEVCDGRLVLFERDLDAPLNLPIDKFLMSVAREYEDQGCAVILSGTGTDGTRGARLLRDLGGLVIVQDPEEAKFDGMPRSVINSGASDLVLPAHKIPSVIVRYIKHSSSRPPRSAGDGIDPALFGGENAKVLENIFRVLETHSGIDFSRYKSSTVARRIERRVIFNQMTDLREYFTLLSGSKQEQEILSSELLINVTQFFRDTPAFETMKREVIPALLANGDPAEDVRVWVPGCSTGEEALSLAILFSEQRSKLKSPRRVRIFATDVDVQVVADATAGTYPAGAMTDVAPELISKYFQANHDGTFTVVPSLRQMVVFAVHDITKDPPFSKMDLVSCRNMLIYLRHEVQRQTMEHLVFACKKGGVLFLGSSENLGAAKSEFRPINARQRIYEKIRGGRASSSSFAPSILNRTATRNRELPSVNQIMKRRVRAKKSTPSSIAVDQIVDRFGPPSVLIDADGQAIHAFGGVEQLFTKPKRGEITKSLSTLVVPDLQTAVSNLVNTLKESQEDAVFKGVQVRLKEGEDPHDFDIHANRLIAPSDEPVRYVVSFLNVQGPQPRKPSTVAPITYDERAMADKRVANLEHELKAARQHLQVTVEELESTNEELQSSNEELLAANEELQSTNEELQSVNEEMHTVNFEYQEKIDELLQVNALLDGVLRTTAAGMIYLDLEMTVRKFTPQVREFVHLMETDLGRPFSHVRNRLKYRDFDVDLRRARQTGDATQRQVQSDDGRDVLVTINSYEEGDGGRRGVVVSILDITEQTAQQRVLDSARSELQAAREVARRERRLQLALSTSKIGTWQYDLASGAMAGDARAKALVSTSTGVFPISILELEACTVPADRGRVSALFDLDVKEDHRAVEFRVLRSDGDERVVHFAGDVERSEDGKVTSIYGICMDVSPKAVVRELLRSAGQSTDKTPHCLYIEDDDDDAQLMTDAVNKIPPGQAVMLDRVEDLTEARRRLASTNYDLILLDLSLPESVGVNSVALMREMAPDKPVVVLTGSLDPELPQQVIALGAQDYLLKGSLDPTLLSRTVRFAISRHAVAKGLNRIA